MPRRTHGTAISGSRLLNYSLTLERGDTVRPAQSVRVDIGGGSDQLGPEIVNAEAGETSLVLYGPPTFDVARGDVFQIGSLNCRVVLVEPAISAVHRVAYAIGRES